MHVCHKKLLKIRSKNSCTEANRVQIGLKCRYAQLFKFTFIWKNEERRPILSSFILYPVFLLQVYGRDIVEAHYRACLYAGIRISGTNAEVGDDEAGIIFLALRLCRLNGSSKLAQLRGLTWETTFGWPGYHRIIIGSSEDHHRIIKGSS